MVSKESSPTIRAEVPIETMAGVGRIVERFRVSLGQREVFLGDTKPGSHRAAGGSLAVLAIAVGNEGRIGIELEFDRAAGALGSVFLRHLSAPLWRCCRRTLRGDRYLGYRDVLLDGNIMTIGYVLRRRRAPKGLPLQSSSCRNGTPAVLQLLGLLRVGLSFQSGHCLEHGAHRGGVLLAETLRHRRGVDGSRGGEERRGHAELRGVLAD